MPEDISPTTNGDGRFERVLAELLEAEERGEPVDLSQAIRGAPEFAAPLREYFRNRDGFDRVAPGLAPIPPRPGAQATPLDLLPGGRFGDYEIVGELGRGGMGVVYKARQLSLQRLVALKMILAGNLAGPEQVKRFHREAQTVARLDHPNIVPIYAVGRHNGQHFFSMKLIEGTSLSRELAHYRRHHKAAAFLLAQVARAVHCAHQRGVLHRDLKPGNILLDARKQPHVTDFGLAQWLGDSATLSREGTVIGTASYMAPEQAVGRNLRLTPTADVYSLGAILYEMLTGRPPFQGATILATLVQVLDQPPVPPRQLNAAVPRNLETICLRCLDKRPAHRYASAEALAEDLERWVEGKPIVARPVHWPERAWLWCRRRPAIAALSAAAVALSAAAVVLVTLAGALYWAYASASKEVVNVGAQARKADEVRGQTEVVLGQVKQEATENKAKLEQTEVDLSKTRVGLDQEQERLRRRQYLKDMGRVQKHIDGGELTQARALLAQWRPQAEKTDLRAWEWYFLEAQLRDAGFAGTADKSLPSAAGFRQRAYRGPVRAVAWSPDGAQLASADGEGTIIIWDVAGDKKLREFSTKAGETSALAWSPDGKRLAAACTGGFDGPTSPPLPQAAVKPPKTTPSTKPALGSGTVHVWDLDTGKPLPTLRQAAYIHPATARHLFLGSWGTTLFWNPNNQKLALADEDGKIQVWDLSTKKTNPHVLPVHVQGVHTAAYSPDGTRLAAVSEDALVRIWDAATDKLIDEVSIRRDGDQFTMPSYALTWTEDGKGVKVVAGNGAIQVVDLGSRKVTLSGWLVPLNPLAKLGVDQLGSHGERFLWSPDGKRLASIQHRGVVIFWDPATGKGGASIVAPGVDMMSTGRCSPAWDRSGQRLALGGADGTVVAWPVAPARQPVPRPVRDLKVDGLTWSADGRHIVGLRDMQQDNIDDLKEKSDAARAQLDQMMKGFGQPPGPGVPPQPPMPGTPPPGLVPWAPAGQKPRPQIAIYDAGSGELVRRLGNNDRPEVLAESPPDGKWIAAATSTGLLQLWPTAGGEPVTLQKPGGAAPLFGGMPNNSVVLSWRPDGKRLAFSTPGQTTIRLWDPADPHQPVKELKGHGAFLRSLAWNQDGTRLASAGNDGTVKVWDVHSGSVIADIPVPAIAQGPNFVTMTPRQPSIMSLSPDGKRLAVAGEDEKVRIVDVDAQQELKTLPGHPSRYELHGVVCAVAWSPDGKRLAAASPDGTYLLWDTDLWEEILALTPPDTRQLGMMNRLGALTWSRDGRRLAYFSNVMHRGSVLIWDAAPEVQAPARPQAPVSGAAAPGAQPAPPVPDENRIVEALAKVGAGIRRDEKQPGKPVVWVELTNKTKVTDADLKDVKYLTILQTLNLGVTRVTDDCLKELKGLKNLQALQVPLTQVTDKGLPHLKDHHGLQILNLAGTRVTDRGLENLKGLRQLRLLDLTGTQVTDAGLKRIREALPQCRVIK